MCFAVLVFCLWAMRHCSQGTVCLASIFDKACEMVIAEQICRVIFGLDSSKSCKVLMATNPSCSAVICESTAAYCTRPQMSKFSAGASNHSTSSGQQKLYLQEATGKQLLVDFQPDDLSCMAVEEAAQLSNCSWISKCAS